MKYLSEITEEAISAIFEKYGAFFAFSTEQFNESAKPGVKYGRLPFGLICPVKHGQAIQKELAAANEAGIKKDIEMHGREAIILRELNNYEAFYTYDLEPVDEALFNYPGITPEMIRKVFINNRPQ